MHASAKCRGRLVEVIRMASPLEERGISVGSCISWVAVEESWEAEEGTWRGAVGVPSCWRWILSKQEAFPKVQGS